MSSNNLSTILVVDDEEAVRRFVHTVLTQVGYRVLQAPGGLEAMSVTLSFVGDISLVVSDMFMPGVSGLDLANQLAMDRPQTKILYISGDIQSVALDSVSRQTPQAVLPKPFTGHQLVERVREILGE